MTDHALAPTTGDVVAIVAQQLERAGFPVNLSPASVTVAERAAAVILTALLHAPSARPH